MPATFVDNCNIDECNVTMHICTGDHMHCEDTTGSYACICDSGYRWNDEKGVGTAENPYGRSPTPDDNYWVYDIDSDPSNLTNHVGSGLYDATAGDSCVDYNECANDNPSCPVNATCSNLDKVATGREYQCLCDIGYAEVYDLSSNGTDLEGDLFYGTLQECVDFDECANGDISCSGSLQCVNTDGSYYCGCNVGFTTDAECTLCINSNILNGDADELQCVRLFLQIFETNFFYFYQKADISIYGLRAFIRQS